EVAADPGLGPGGDEVVEVPLARHRERRGEDLPGRLERAVDGPQQRQHHREGPHDKDDVGDAGEGAVAVAAAGPTRRDPTRAALSCGDGGVEGRGLGHASSFDRLPNSTMTAISIVTSASTTPIAEARPNCERAKAVS